MQDNIRKHSYFTMLNAHIGVVFVVVAADMKLRGAKLKTFFLD